MALAMTIAVTRFPPYAPSTALRAVPLPRFAGQDEIRAGPG
jgi:hypothetical protein